MNSNELRQLIETTGVSMVMSTRDENLWPDLCEVLGLHFNENASKAMLFVSEEHAAKCLSNIKNNGCIAISLSRPCTFQAAQLKGKVANVHAMTAEEKDKSLSWSQRFRKEIQLIGVPNEAAMGLRLKADMTIEVDIENIFIQTPGPQAGQKLERA